uniref:BTB domain-containing protein n=1 Tax=Chelydra serpentina TaxID=8475 RepID=A0A8C3SKN9_CHESE
MRGGGPSNPRLPPMQVWRCCAAPGLSKAPAGVAPPALCPLYTLEEHTKQAFGIMNQLRLSQQLCDVTLRVRYQDAPPADFQAHKVVLASSSPVFKAMFTTGLREQAMEVVPIEGIHPRVMERLIEFAYTASISVGEKCVVHVMNGAVMYQIDSVVKACCDFLVQQLDPSNAIGIANFAEQIGCTELHQRAREYIYMNFGEVSGAAGRHRATPRAGAPRRARAPRDPPFPQAWPRGLTASGLPPSCCPPGALLSGSG